MTAQEQNQTLLLDSLETTRQQITATQSEIETVVNRMQTLTTQIETALKSLDSLKAAFDKIVDDEQNAENNSEKVAETLEEMFRQVSNIVNNAKEKLNTPKPQEEIAERSEIATPLETPTIAVNETATVKITDEIHTAEAAEPIEEITRATAAAIPAITIADQEISQTPEIQASEIIEPTSVVPPEQATVTPPEPQKKFDDAHQTAVALNEMLAKAKAMTGSIAEAATDTEEDDISAVDELLKTASSSFVAN
ncbi:MAG: hypothetical protein LBJ67_11580 [Planctomycetaceae bacterium]|jgi:uncharacterized protein YukE|nr:hypothetical protein [Planctomycetaceae bacterium]